jgi:hypothetical protein
MELGLGVGSIEISFIRKPPGNDYGIDVFLLA